MASTYTAAGIELIAQGEQAGAWGNTTNTNWELIEEMVGGVVSVALSSTSETLTTSDGAASDGRHAVINFTGTPGGTCTVTISPNDMQKVYFVLNNSDETVTLSQGSGANVNIAAGKAAIVYCDGAGAGAAVVDITASITKVDQTGDTMTGVLAFDGTTSNTAYLRVDTDVTSHPSHTAGNIFWCPDQKAVSFHNDISGVSMQIGHEDWVRVKNISGSTISNGTPVYVTGESSGIITVSPADATTEAKSQVLGIATADIANNAEGVATVRGLVNDIDTSALTAGERVHVGADGSLQTAAPTYPYFPTDVGTCIVSNASTGKLYVSLIEHTFEQFRVTGNSHMDGNLTVEGDFTVTGTQSITSQTNLNVDNSFVYMNSGNTIGSANTTFTGSGLDDGILTGHFEGTSTIHYYVRIDSVGGGTDGVDTFEWSKDNFSTTEATDVDIDTDGVELDNGISITFNADTGHTLNDKWDGEASPVNVDTGFFTNRNTGGSGVGYTHAGIYFDVSDQKWKAVEEYDPEPEGTINTGHASFNLGTFVADTFEGALTGNVTGNVTGDLTGDVTGNADTATTLTGLTATVTELNYVDGVTSNIQTQINNIDTDLSNDTSPQLGGDLDTNGSDITFGDNDKAIFGAGSDLQIYHDGTHSYIRDEGTGDLSITTSGGQISMAKSPFEYMARFGPDGACQFYYDNSKKFETTSTGVSVTGNIAVSGTVDGVDIAALDSSLGALATRDSVTASQIDANAVGASEIAANAVGASELNVSGNGTTAQFLRSDGDGTFTWATPTDTNTTYSADGNYGLTLSGTTFRLEDDRRRNSTSVDIYSGNTHDYTFYDASIGIRWYTAGAEEMRLENDGDLHVDGDVIAHSTTVSDERLKENIVGIDGALDKVAQLNGYTFNYKADGRISAGVIAQEVEKVLPEAVAEKGLPYEADDDQMYKVVSYDALHGLLIEAVKELSAKVKELEAKVG